MLAPAAAAAPYTSIPSMLTAANLFAVSVNAHALGILHR